MGCIDAVVAHARTARATGEDRWAVELLKHALTAGPDRGPPGRRKPYRGTGSVLRRPLTRLGRFPARESLRGIAGLLSRSCAHAGDPVRSRCGYE
ncbi:hypothetical protein ACFYMI_23310 [Streptomyces collinus]|uniref:hypothetical protein n=1 Tax=Streptomyces collinus TaxID=42684 RepID=UPI00368FAC73